MFARATANARKFARESRLNKASTSKTFPGLGISCAYPPCLQTGCIAGLQFMLWHFRIRCPVSMQYSAWSGFFALTAEKHDACRPLACAKLENAIRVQDDHTLTLHQLLISCFRCLFCAYTALTRCKETNPHGRMWKCSCALLLLLPRGPPHGLKLRTSLNVVVHCSTIGTHRLDPGERTAPNQNQYW